MTATPKFIAGASLILVSFILSTFPIEDLIKKFWAKEKPKNSIIKEKPNEKESA